MPAEQAFRDATADAVRDRRSRCWARSTTSACRWRTRCGFEQVGSTPVDPSTAVGPGLHAERPARSTRRSSTTTSAAPTRCRSSTGASRATASSAPTTRARTRPIGGNENPYPTSYASKPTLGQYAGYDTNDDTIQHLNYFASGTTHGPGGVDVTVGGAQAGARTAGDLDRLPDPEATEYGGAEPKSANPVAYFETGPAKPTTTNTVTFDASFSRAATARRRA